MDNSSNHNECPSKDKPRQISSVASGTHKRLQGNAMRRKSSRLSILDHNRSLPRDNSPAPHKSSLPKLSKHEQRLQQLAKWKEEKTKKIQEIARPKKKLLDCGPSTSKGFLPPPTAKVLTSTSRRVTISQTGKTGLKTEQKPILKIASTKTHSFASKTVKFRPPEFANIPELPKCMPLMKDKKDTKVFEFKPVLANSGENSKIIPTSNKITGQVNTTTTTITNEKDTRNKTKQDNANSNKKNNIEIKKLPQPISNKTRNKTENHKIILKNNIKPSNPGAKLKETPNKSALPKVVLNKSPVPTSESSMEQKLRSPTDTQIEAPRTPALSEILQQTSPFVTASREKGSAIKEMKKNMNDGILNCDEVEIDSVAYFSQVLESESKRITAMYETWLKIMGEIHLPDSVQELVLEATGQARLLLSSKLAQFRRLVQRCAEPAPSGPAMRVLTEDLRGFWDMVYMQIKNIDMRFKKLEDLKSKNWIEEQEAVQIVPKAKVIKTIRVIQVKSTASPGLKAMIEAARKAKKEKQQSDKLEVPVSSDKDENTVEAGFFVRSPVRSPAASHIAEPCSLFKTELSNEAKIGSSDKDEKKIEAGLFVRSSVRSLAPSSIPKPYSLLKTVLSNEARISASKEIPKKDLMQKFTDFDSLIVESGDRNALERNKENVAKSPKTEQNENKSKKKPKAKSSRQDDVNRSPVMTRSRLRRPNNT